MDTEKEKDQLERPSVKSEPRRRAQGTMSLSVSAFPDELWKEWNMDCKLNYGDCRWIKMWNDHQRSKHLLLYEDLVQRVSILERLLFKPQEKPKEGGKVKTFTKEL